VKLFGETQTQIGGLRVALFEILM